MRIRASFTRWLIPERHWAASVVEHHRRIRKSGGREKRTVCKKEEDRQKERKKGGLRTGKKEEKEKNETKRESLRECRKKEQEERETERIVMQSGKLCRSPFVRGHASYWFAYTSFSLLHGGVFDQSNGIFSTTRLVVGRDSGDIGHFLVAIRQWKPPTVKTISVKKKKERNTRGVNRWCLLPSGARATL